MLKIAYLSTNNQVRPRKPTQREQLHADAIATLAITKINDRQKSLKRFAGELAELGELKQRLSKLTSANPDYNDKIQE